MNIVADGLRVDYGAVRAVDDVTFAARPGRVTGFLGPNGAGKTTTLRMLLGLIRPTAGSATIEEVRRRTSDGARITFLDVGQGDAAALRLALEMLPARSPKRAGLVARIAC